MLENLGIFLKACLVRKYLFFPQNLSKTGKKEPQKIRAKKNAEIQGFI